MEECKHNKLIPMYTTNPIGFGVCCWDCKKAWIKKIDDNSPQPSPNSEKESVVARAVNQKTTATEDTNDSIKKELSKDYE